MNHLGTIELETDRLILRKFKETDAKAIFDSFVNNEKFLYYANKEPRTLEQEEESLKGIEENESDPKPYYADSELTLLHRIMEFRDNYTYWVLDFDIPVTNNTAERALRGVKSKMKAAGQTPLRSSVMM